MSRTHRARLSIAVCALLALALTTQPGAAVAGPRPGGTATAPQVAAQADTGHKADTEEDRGAWRVARLGPHEHTVSWTSPTRLPVTGARPEIVRDGAPLGATVLSRDGRTVRVRVRGDVAPDPAALDVQLSGRLLDEPGRPEALARGPQGRRTAAAPAPAPTFDVDPGLRGDLEVTSSDYRLPGFRFGRMPRKLEMVGHVVRPADGQLSAPSPLVVFLHGRHDFCYDPGDDEAFGYRWPCRPPMKPIPSHLGYDYVQRLLASQGYTTLSVAANGINAQDHSAPDGGAQARARLVRRHLRQWVAWVEDGSYDVDLDNVVLVGHSRGGEGVNRAALETPLGAPYRITGQVLLAPTNFARQTTAYVPTVTVLPYCDGDVTDLQGQAYTDLARDLVRDDTSLRSTVLVMGANHNFFNTEWTPGISAAPSFDDFSGPRTQTCGKASPGRLSAVEQRRVGKAYVAGAVQLMTGADPATLAMFDGTRGSVASAGGADVRTHALGGGRTLRRPGTATTVAPQGGAVTRLCSGYVGVPRPRACGRDFAQGKAPHWVPRSLPGVPTTPALEMSWDVPGQRGGLRFDNPLDASAAASLDLRTVVDPRLGTVRVGVRLVDADGRQVTLTPEANGRVPALPRGRQRLLGKLLAQTLRVPLAGVGSVDLSRLVEVGLVGRSADGRVWVLDIAAVPDGPLPAVPAKRLPVLDLGSARQVEGDRPGRSHVTVPYTLSAPSTVPVRFVVAGFREYDGRALAPRRVVVAPGRTMGTIRVGYRGNRRDDLHTRAYSLAAFALRDVMTRDGIGRIRLLDDDPRPRLRVRRTPARQVEGRALTWTLELSKPVGYDVFVEGVAVRGTTNGPRLSVGDLPRRFAERSGLGRARSRTPLHRAGLGVFTRLRAGHRSVRLRIPLRVDGRNEPPESLTLRLHAYPFRTRVSTSYAQDRHE